MENITEDELFEMCNLRKRQTGIDNIIWVSVKNANHGPRVKVQWGDSIRESVSISIHKTNPTVVAGNEKELSANTLRRVKKWIVLNYDVLMNHWNMTADTADLIFGLKKLNESFFSILQDAVKLLKG